jgi:hypothetical protein
VSRGIAWYAVVMVGLTGCAGSATHGLASGTLRLLGWEGTAPHAVLVDRLELPEDGELVIAPTLLKIAEAPKDGTPVRVQFLLRAVRSDGGIQQWLVGADGRASSGERGFQLAQQSSVRASFGGADYGPVRVASLVRLEVAIAQVPTEPSREPRFLAMAALKDIGAVDEESREVLAADGARPVLASTLSIVGVPGAAPGRQTWRLVVIGDSTGGTERVARLHQFDGAQLLDGSGEPVEGLSFVVLDLHITVPDHR